MTEEDIPKLQRIAYSEKKVGEEAGYKGIGRLAGIAVAEKIEDHIDLYTATRSSITSSFVLRTCGRTSATRRSREINEQATPVIKRHTKTWWTDIDPADHYTLVEIRNIKDSCDELLDPDKLIEYIGDIGPVDFSPEFKEGALISENLQRHVPDYSPKTIYLSRPDGKKVRVYKPYSDDMKIAAPRFMEIPDPTNAGELLAYCWYASNAEEILGKMRPSGKIFQVEGEEVEERRRFAGPGLQVVRLLCR